MHEWNQAPEPPRERREPDPADPLLPPGGAPEDAVTEPLAVPLPPLPPDPAIARARRGLLIWFFTLLVFGTVGLKIGQVETAALLTLAVLYATAHAAEIDPRSHMTWQLVSWVVPAGALLTFAGLFFMLSMSELTGIEKPLSLAASGLAIAIAGLLLVPSISNGLTRRMLRAEPTPVRTLTMRLAVYSIVLALPGWFMFDSMRETFLAKPESVMDPSHLSGGLIGYVLLAAGGVGWLVRRGLRAALQRLGIQVPRWRDALVVVLGVAALVALNAAGDAIQHRWFPGLWQSDHAFTKALASRMGGPQTLLLGLSAGVGEEITMRGALQPRLGLVLTSLTFAALHVQYSWWGMLMIFLLGLILGTIRNRTSTSTAMLVHAVYDVLAVFSE